MMPQREGPSVKRTGRRAADDSTREIRVRVGWRKLDDTASISGGKEAIDERNALVTGVSRRHRNLREAVSSSAIMYA